MRRATKSLLVAASCLSMWAAGATAQTVAPKRVVAFGDSYADDGNVFQLTGTSQPQVYPTGRFSGGTNFIDTLQQLFGAEQLNFAIGGAFTGPGNSGFNNISGPGIPGFQFEVDSFLAGGGGVFPTLAPRFEADDLLAVSIGGNDARFYQFSGGTVAGAGARAAISVAEAKGGLDRLVGAGARNIAFLAGNVGDLPEVRGTPISAVGSAFSNAFNAGIQAPLAGYAANGVLVHYLDLTIVGNQIRANPAAYGLASADACPTACVLNPELQKQFLFYVDRVHLTSAGFAIVAAYFQRMIEAPGMLAATSDLGLSSAQAFAGTMGGRNELGGDGDPERPIGFYLLATLDRHDERASSTSLAYDYTNVGVTGGVEYDAGSGVFAGLALGYARPRADFARSDGRVEGDSYHAGVYASFAAAGFSVSGTAGYGKTDYDIERRAVIDDIRAETDGTSYSASAEASYGFPLREGLTIGPVVNVSYARATIDGYTEQGDAALTLAVQRQRVSALIGQAGLEAKGDFTVGDAGVTPYLIATLAKELDGSGGTLRFAGTASPTIVNRFDTGDEPNDIYGLIEAGASFAIGPNVSAQVQARGSIEQPGGDETSGFLGVKVAF